MRERWRGAPQPTPRATDATHRVVLREPLAPAVAEIERLLAAGTFVSAPVGWRQNQRVDELKLERIAQRVAPLRVRCAHLRRAVGDAPPQSPARGELRRSRIATLGRRILLEARE